MSEELKEAKPTDLFLVPLFVESLYKNIWRTAKANGKDGLLRKMIKVSRFLQKLGIDARRKIFRSVLEGFGGNVEVVVSGGAPLNSTYIQCFRDFGMELLNGYGITECSPVIAVNRNRYYRDGSVGQILNECEVRIDRHDDERDGEIVVKGNIVMQGYYNMENETREVLEDGWFRTGDLGYVDDDGFLFITGRKKNLIILPNGENVSPEEVEDKLLDIEYIKEVVVYEKEQKLVAEVYPDPDVIAENKAEDIKRSIREQIEKLGDTLPPYMRVSEVSFRDTEFEKNTTKKILRYKVGKKA